MAWQPPDNNNETHSTSKSVKPGKITAIEAQKKNTNRVSVYIEDKFGFGLHHDVLLQYGVHSGQDLDEARIQELQSADALIRAKEVAITYLGHRARTENEVRQKLRGKGYEAEIIDQVIQRLHELSYLDDAHFARSYTKNRFKFKGHGPQRIRADLRRLGIAPPLIEEALTTVMPDDEIVEKAMAEAEKRLKRLRKEPDLSKRRQKLYGFLMRRGHTPDVVREVLEKIEW